MSYMSSYDDWFDMFASKAMDAGFIANQGDNIAELSVIADASVWNYGEPMMWFTLDLDSDGEDKRYWVIPHISFPDLDGDAVDYGDSIEYVCKKFYERIGRFCTWLAKYPFIEYANEEDEYEEEY